jgi:hypothetical protein
MDFGHGGWFLTIRDDIDFKGYYDGLVWVISLIGYSD